MRRFIHALLIALLLLRGGMDAAMATSMASAMPATSHQAMMKADVATSHAEPAAIGGQHDTPMADCAGHSAALQNHDTGAVAATTADIHTNSSHADCDSCSVCQACHSVALSSSTAATAHAQAVSAMPDGVHSHFASADTALGQKPPIS